MYRVHVCPSRYSMRDVLPTQMTFSSTARKREKLLRARSKTLGFRTTSDAYFITGFPDEYRTTDVITHVFISLYMSRVKIHPSRYQTFINKIYILMLLMVTITEKPEFTNLKLCTCEWNLFIIYNRARVLRYRVE